MAASKTPEQIDVILNTQQKTVRYAQDQIGEGELMNGKSILDTTLRQLKGQSWKEYASEFESRRQKMMQDIQLSLEQLKMARLMRINSAKKNPQKIPSIG